jgi:hypothetical protein
MLRYATDDRVAARRGGRGHGAMAEVVDVDLGGRKERQTGRLIPIHTRLLVRALEYQ